MIQYGRKKSNFVQTENNMQLHDCRIFLLHILNSYHNIIYSNSILRKHIYNIRI